jgi:hypothetical protein
MNRPIFQMTHKEEIHGRHHSAEPITPRRTDGPR